MISFVLDASVAGSWLGDEPLSEPDKALQFRALNREALVPVLFRSEIANVALSKFRSLRIEDQDFVLDILKDWRLQVDPYEPSYEAVIHTAMKCRVTAYDATYLELAKRRNLPLATLDKGMRKAAKSLDVKLLKW